MLLAKFLITLATLWVSGFLIGTSAIIRTPMNRMGMMIAQSNQPVIVSGAISTNDALVAVHTEKLDQIARDNQASIDDRKQMQYQLNTLSARLSVDEAQLKGAGWTFGIILSALNALHTVLLVMDYRRRKQGERSEP